LAVDAEPEISVVVPTLDEEGNVIEMANAIDAAMIEAGIATYELIFIDNGSTDRTVELVKTLCTADPRIKLIVNARNFGQMRSPTHGIYQARGQGVIGMCADFQDPPTLLPEIIRHWREGYKIVLGVRAAEKTSLLLGLVRKFGYWFLGAVGDYPVIPGATGFGIYDRSVLDVVSTWNEPEPFFRGMLAETGLPLKTIPFQRPVRAKGRTKNDIATLTSFAISGLASSSKTLLRLPLFVALGVGALALLLLLGSGLATITGGPALLLFFGSLAALAFAMLSLFLGLLGEQVRLISERTRQTKLVVEKERVNF
jgi:hypothetical protein